METLNHLSALLGNVIWGPVLIFFLVGTGVYLTLILKAIQLRKLSHSVAIISGKYDNPRDQGEISHFQALSTALSATIGTGNIAGVATAIASGGPGAVFWMWVTAIFGMATKYSSCLLSLKYRKLKPDGSVSGGPMYYLTSGLKAGWLGWLFAFFACLASFGIGNMVQANSVANPLNDILGIPKPITGFLMAILVGMVIIGGIKRIGNVAARIVPFMTVVYILGAMTIIVINLEKIPEALNLIFYHAFTPTAAAGGFLGTTVMQTLRFGVARGVFSNESGLGSAPIAHAAARTNEPVREGLVAMIGPLIDTLLICTMTAVVIVLSGLWKNTGPNGVGLTGATLCAKAFEATLPIVGHYIVSFGLIFFAFSTIIGWSYYGDRCAEYLFGPGAVMPYRWIYVLLIPLGATVKLELIWNLSDVANGLMAFPNLIGILGLSGVIVRETRNYFFREEGGDQMKLSG